MLKYICKISHLSSLDSCLASMMINPGSMYHFHLCIMAQLTSLGPAQLRSPDLWKIYFITKCFLQPQHFISPNKLAGLFLWQNISLDQVSSCTIPSLYILGHHSTSASVDSSTMNIYIYKYIGQLTSAVPTQTPLCFKHLPRGPRPPEAGARKPWYF